MMKGTGPQGGAFRECHASPPYLPDTQETRTESSLIARHMEEAQHQPRVELYLRMAIQYITNILRSEPFAVDRPSSTESILRV